MKKIFSEAEVELTLLTSSDILTVTLDPDMPEDGVEEED